LKLLSAGQCFELVSSEIKRVAEMLYKENSIPNEQCGLFFEACNYALDNPGKLCRPILTLLTNQAFGGYMPKALPAALACEWIHTYSLIHDDLPAMDDDDMRRGKASVHKKFNEATAILLGDALLTDAFLLLSDQETYFPQVENLPPITSITLIKELSLSSGSSGMVLGQAIDMFAEASYLNKQEDLNALHMKKTGALFSFCFYAGGLTSLQQANLQELKQIGLNVGLCFQMIDDLIDSYENTGKNQNSDLEKGKKTFLTVLGEEKTRDLVETIRESYHKKLLDLTGSLALPLIKYLDSLIKRKI
jgi:geranylgeranyl pyrophosphate synthase